MVNVNPARMKRRKLFIRLALLALAVGLVVFALVRPSAREPVHLGRPLREWLVEFDNAQNYLAAQEAIRAMGTNSLPFLIRYLRSKDPPFNEQRVRLKARLNLLRKGGEYAGLWHRRAARACAELGQAGAPAFPALMEAMNYPHAADDVASALARMLPGSAPVLTNISAMGNETARCRAADMLGMAYSLPETEEMARTALLRGLRDRQSQPRACAAAALGRWNQRRDVIMPALTSALSDPDAIVRGVAATSLGNFGNSARIAVPELLKLLQDTNDYPRKRATEALQKIDPEAATKAAGN